MPNGKSSSLKGESYEEESKGLCVLMPCLCEWKNESLLETGGGGLCRQKEEHSQRHQEGSRLNGARGCGKQERRRRERREGGLREEPWTK